MFRDCCGICVIIFDVMIKLFVIIENNKLLFILIYCDDKKKYFLSRYLNVIKKKIFKI